MNKDEIDSPSPGLFTHKFLKRLLVLTFLLLILGCGSTMIVAESSPYLATQIADQIRDAFGPRVVAGLETVVFRLQDALNNWSYRINQVPAEPPWVDSTSLQETASSLAIDVPKASLTPEPLKITSTPIEVRTTPIVKDQPLTSEEVLSTEMNPSTPTTKVEPWLLPTLQPFGILEGEGIWQPYLHDLEGEVVAYRTFLQPDPDRPYTIVAVVAFDLNHTRLHFVLGFNEPSVPDGPRGDGLIPEVDRQQGNLLAAFNGGFRAANGHFGAMADGTVALEPKDDFATVAIYENGEVRIGEWGREIMDSPDMRSWRQNCRLIIHNGEISPRVYNNSITDWGASINNQIVTRRSGLGLDRNAETLFYFAGPSLSMPVLADSMLAVGVHNGMLLDINHFWVHFTAIRMVEGAFIAEPLLPDEMIDRIDRYLNPSPVDFFYVTSVKPLNTEP